MTRNEMKRKVELTLKQMVEAVKVNGKEPWNVVGIGRSSWFRGLKKNGTTMKELQSQSQSQSIGTSADVPVRTIHPVPQWSPTLCSSDILDTIISTLLPNTIQM